MPRGRVASSNLDPHVGWCESRERVLVRRIVPNEENPRRPGPVPQMANGVALVRRRHRELDDFGAESHVHSGDAGTGRQGRLDHGLAQGRLDLARRYLDVEHVKVPREEFDAWFGEARDAT